MESKVSNKSKSDKKLIAEALEKVKTNELTIYSAAKKFNVSRSTLKRKYLNFNNNELNRNKTGATQFISIESERKIAVWIGECAAKGDPRTKDDLLKAAKEYDIFENKPPRFAASGPSKKWFKGFMLRHPEVCFRKPESISKSAATVNIRDIDRFFVNFETWLNEQGLLGLLERPDAWFNLDETGFDLNSPPKRVLATKGMKDVYTVNAARLHDNITATFCFSAAGIVMPPQLIFKDSFTKLLEVCYAAGELKANFFYRQTSSGWQTKESFRDYIEALDAEIEKKNIERPVVFLFDGHASHMNVDLYIWCRERKIIVVVLPPNTTHVTQMCDTAVFGPLKSAWRSQVTRYKHDEGKVELDHTDFIKILVASMNTALKPETIKNGFKSTGIFPFNRDAVHRERLVGTDSNSKNSSSNEQVNSMQIDIPADHDDMDIENNINDELCNVKDNKTSSPQHMMSYHDDIFFDPIDSPLFLSQVQNSSPLIDRTQLISKIKPLAQQLLSSYEKDDDHYLNALIIMQQLNIISPEPAIGASIDVIESINVEEPILQPPKQFSRVGKSRQLKVNHGVMTSDAYIEKSLEIQRDKERIQREKEERKVLREQQKLIKDNIIKIKKEKADEAKAQKLKEPPKKRGRKAKSAVIIKD